MSLKQSKFKDETGNIYGLITVLSRSENDIHGNAKWNVKCECGKVSAAIGASLRAGKIRSCKRCSRITHGMTASKEFMAWDSMKSRCFNPKNRKYKRYGGRGIKVCDRWASSFENFFYDMGFAGDGMTLDRKDNDGDYEPKNCRWVSFTENNRNRSNTKMLIIDGKEIPAAEYAENIGIDKYLFLNRITRLNWSVEKAVLKGVQL